MRVLVVEDEPLMALGTKTALEHAAIAVDVAPDGEAALEALDINRYDVALLDRDLSGISGDEVCRIINERHREVRVVMLTAARRLDDKVRGLELGADDYLTKPFEIRELVARLRALERRPVPAQRSVLRVGDLELNPFRLEVLRGGHPVRLTRKEFAILHLLVAAGGGVVSAEELLEQAWDENANPFTNTIRVTVSTLRKKLGGPSIIETVPGSGYRVSGA